MMICWRAEARIKGSIRCSSRTMGRITYNEVTFGCLEQNEAGGLARDWLCGDPDPRGDVADPHAPCRARPDVLGVRPRRHHRLLAQPATHDAPVLRRLTALHPDQRAPRRRGDSSDSTQVRL